MASLTQIVTNAATAAGVPPAIALAQAQQESGFNPNIVNAKSGATGLMQLEPGTAADLGVTNPFDPVQNAQGGTTYLAQLYARFGDWATALAAYDWGPTNVANAQAAHGANWLSYAPSETQNYVSSILGNAGMLAAPSTSAGAAAPIDTSSSDLIDSALSPILLDTSGGAGVQASPNWLLIVGAGLAAWLALSLLLEG